MNMPSRCRYTSMQRRAEKRERGSLLVQFAVMLSVLVAILGVVDIGYMYYAKRDLQRIADLAALEAASAIGVSARDPQEACVEAGRRAIDNNWPAALVRDVDVVPVNCGHWVEQPGVKEVKSDGALNAAHVVLQAESLRLLPGTWSRTVMAEATARTQARVAQLSVRSQLLEIASENSPLLNALVGGLLGGNLNIGVMGWEGLAQGNVKLLEYLDALKLELGLQAGGYDQLLDADVGVGVLLRVLADVLEQQGNTAGVALQALESMAGLALPVPGLQLKLADLLGLQAGAADTALRTNLNVLELVMATVQVGNSNSALSAGVELPLGVLNASVALKVIEPPQLSLARDPELARQNPYGPDQIFVRTAQTRLLVSVEVPVLGALSSAVNGLLTLLSPVLNLANLLTGGFTFGGVEYIDAQVLPTPFRLDIGIDVAASQANLTDYQCMAGNKTVTASVSRSVSDIRVGRWGNSKEEARNNAFSSTSLSQMQPVPVVRLDCIGCDGVGKRTPQYFGGLGLKLELPLVANAESVVIPVPDGDGFSEPVDSSSDLNLIRSLGPTVMGLNALPSLPADPRASPAGVGGILKAVSGLLGSVLGLVNSLLVTVLAPVLDPVLNGLLRLLGLGVAEAGVGARLVCGGGAELVY